MAKVLPTLDSSSWVVDKAIIADRLLAYFFNCERNVSYSFREHIASLPDLIKKFQHEPYTLKDEINKELGAIFKRYFEIVIPDTSIEEKGDGSGYYTIHISLNIGDGEYRYSVARLVQVIESKLAKIVNLNNNGGI